MCTQIFPGLGYISSHFLDPNSNSNSSYLESRHRSRRIQKVTEEEEEMATIAGLSLSGPGVMVRASESQKGNTVKFPVLLGQRFGSGRMRAVRIVRAAPDRISEKVEESIKKAEETCSDDPASGECVAAWDEVEELSAAASHARDRKKKESDPLENYCADNPEVDECRTYDN